MKYDDMIKVIMGGYEAWHPSTYQMSRPNGLPNYVLLIIRTHGEFLMNDMSYIADARSALVISPKTSYYYGNPHGDYIDDWMHFEIKECELKQQLDRIANVPFPISNMESYTLYIRQILWELSYGHSDYKNENINALFQVLFNHLLADYEVGKRPESMSPYYSELQMVRLEIASSLPDPHSIEHHARRLRISESYFQHLYKKYFGVSFRHDLIQIRINHAKYLLLTSSLSVQQIAESCGYANEVHFYRQFKKMTGCSPAKFRKTAVL